MQRLYIPAALVGVVIVGAMFLFIGRDQQGEQEVSQVPSPKPLIQLLPDIQGSESAKLEAVDESESSGTAWRLSANGFFQHLVVASMPDPAEGSVYEGWLVQPSPLMFFSTGVMEKNEDGEWVLEYQEFAEYPTYARVVITEETIVDEIPEIHIIEGDF
ncbi:MAG: anti-sigma factor [archaeon]|jgi:hypothetical protein|nr:anti-sigma factor [archaeon]